MGDARSTKRRVLVVTGILLCAGIALGSWFVLWKFYAPNTSESSYGVFGGGFWWSEGKNIVCVGWPTGHPEQNKALFLVLVRYPQAQVFPEYSFKLLNSGKDWKIEYKELIIFPDQRQFTAQYSVSGKDPAEKFMANNKEFSSDKGRVFLVDLTAPEPGIVQIQANLQEVVQAPGSDSTDVDPRPVLREALNKLRNHHDEVRRFLEGSGLK